MAPSGGVFAVADGLDQQVTLKKDGSLNALSKKWFGEKALQF